MTKTDAALGKQVNEFLINLGVNTPTTLELFANDGERKERIEAHFRSIMLLLGLDLTDDSLKDTPSRVAKMYVDEVFKGLKYENFPKCTTVENKMKYDEMVLEKDIQVSSMCEHHLVTIWGKAHVAYIPKNKVLGLSKINRIVDYFARRPQIQERLNEQVFHALQYILETEDVAVVIEAEHFCVKQRGIQDVNSKTITSKIGGSFKKTEVRAEFMSLIK